MEIFKLFGSILVDTDKANESISKTEKKTDGLGKKFVKGAKTVGKWGVAVGGAAAAGGAAIFAMGVKVGNTADRLLDLNSITGMSTDEIQKWQQVATVAGVNAEAMTDASAKLTKQLSLMDTEGNKSRQALEGLGLSIDDINSMDADERMNVISEALMEVEDKTLRAQYGTDLLGGTFEEIAPILDVGKDKLKEIKDNANIISNDDLNKANNFRIQVDQLKERFGLFFMELSIKVLPILTTFFDWIMRYMPQIQSFIEKTFTVISDVIAIAVGWVKENLLPILKSLWDNAQSNLPTFRDTFEKVFKIVKNVISAVWDFIKVNLLPIFQSLFEWVQGHMPTIRETIRTVFEKAESVIKGVWTFVKNNLLPIFANLFEWVQGKMPEIQSIIEKVFGVVAEVVKTVWDLFENFLLPILKGLWDFIKPTFPLIADVVEVAFDTIFWAVDKVVGIFGGLVDVVSSAVKWLTSWNDQDVKDKNVNVNTNYTSTSSSVTGGIPRYANGTNFHPGGMALVGEYGAELVNLPRGSSVKTASETEASMGNTFVTNITVEGNIDKDLYDEIMRKQKDDYDTRLIVAGVR